LAHSQKKLSDQENILTPRQKKNLI
jgi:hypothetical protein